MAIKFLNTVQVDTDVLYVDASNDKVGIGTTSPSTKLEISSSGVNGIDISESASNATQSGRLFFSTNTASEGFALFNSNGTLQINSGGIPNNTSGTNRISIIGSSGNVGIGTTSPGQKLQVYGGLRLGTTGEFNITQSPFTTTVFYVTGGGTGGTITFGAPASYTQNVSVQGDLFSYQGSIGTKQFGSFNNKISYNGNNYLNSGDLGIGTTSPSYKLDVSGEGRFTGDLRCLSLIQTSQRDQKENINDIDKSKAKAIPFKEYTYKSSIDGSSRKRYGVVVEDIEDDYPELVHTDADGVKGVNYIDLLVKRVAELEKELEDISLTQGPKGDTGAAGGDGKDGNSHLSNITSIAFNPKAGRLEVNISGTVYNFVPSK